MNRKLKTLELGRVDVPTYKATEKIPLVVVLDNIRSLNNIGSVFRTSDAFLVEAVYLCGITAKPPHRDITKTALGATESVVWKHFETTMEAIEELQQRNYKILAIEQAEQTIPLQSFETATGQGYALVLGNEVAGVDQTIVDAADACLEIPQHGTKHSLNISVCTGIVIWHFFNQLQK